jgi:hypothetical protein
MAEDLKQTRRVKALVVVALDFDWTPAEDDNFNPEADVTTDKIEDYLHQWLTNDFESLIQEFGFSVDDVTSLYFEIKTPTPSTPTSTPTPTLE